MQVMYPIHCTKIPASIVYFYSRKHIFPYSLSFAFVVIVVIVLTRNHHMSLVAVLTHFRYLHGHNSWLWCIHMHPWLWCLQLVEMLTCIYLVVEYTKLALMTACTFLAVMPSYPGFQCSPKASVAVLAYTLGCNVLEITWCWGYQMTDPQGWYSHSSGTVLGIELSLLPQRQELSTESQPGSLGINSFSIYYPSNRTKSLHLS